MARSSTSPFDSMHWFMGVVEDINDPMGVNRVRVRCLEYHTDNRSNLPTSALPWASFTHSGARMSAPNAVPGDWVIGFFLDGATAQQPIIIGVLDGIPGKPDTSKGFSDPSGTYPKNPGQPTNSPLARGASSSQGQLLSSPEPDVMTASGDTIKGPTSGYAPKYPHNHVIHTDGNNVIEMDDTPGAERINIMHNTGTRVSVAPDGSLITTVQGTTYTISNSSVTIVANGPINLVSQSKVGILSGDAVTIAGKTVTIVSKDDMLVTSGGNLNASAESAFNIGGESVSVDGGSLFAADASEVAISSSMSVPAEKAPPPPSVNSV